MALIGEIVEQIVRAVAGGIDPADSKFDGDYMEEKLDQYREEALNISYNGSRDRAANNYIDPKFLSRVSLTYEIELQETGACYVRFRSPDVVMVDKITDGNVFVGDRKTGRAFSKLLSREQASQLIATGMNQYDIYYLKEGDYIDIFNRDIRQVDVDCIVRRPTKLDISFYNAATDEYPMPDGLIPMVIQLFKLKELNQQAATLADTVTNEAAK